MLYPRRTASARVLGSRSRMDAVATATSPAAIPIKAVATHLGLLPMQPPGYRQDPLTEAFPGERRFSSRVPLRYVVDEGTGFPGSLVVAFSAAAPDGEPQRYYTVRALRSVACTKLFILDDQGPHGPPPRPCWYLGTNRRTEVADSVCELIAAVAQEIGAPRRGVITCGASKGGWAALYFAARFGAGHAVAGEPQVLLGDYLLQDGTRDIARHVAGGVSDNDRRYLNQLLFGALRDSPAHPHIHLYCGRGSSYYLAQADALIGFLDELRIPAELELELGDYGEHVPDLGRHFPAFLTARLTALLERPALERTARSAEHSTRC